MSEDEAWTVISRECVVMAVVLDICRECSVDGEEAVERFESVSDWDDVSSMSSSGMDSVCSFGEAFELEGLNVQGMDSFMRSSSLGIEACVPHSSSFFATHGFWVQRSFEKYALQA
jgi:hypothetical protein